MWHLLQVFFNSAEQERKFLLANRWDLSVMLLLPTLTIGLVWWIFSRSAIVDIPIAVVNHSHGNASETLIRYLDNSPDIKVKAIYAHEQQIKDSIVSRTVYGVVVIPANFDDQLLQGKSADVGLQVNAQYGTHSGIIQKGVQQTVGTLSAGIEINGLVKQGVSLEQAKIQYSPIQIQRVSLFNVNTNYQQFLASTVLPALLHILAMVIGATTIGREVRDKTLDQWYVSINKDNRKISPSDQIDQIAPIDQRAPTDQIELKEKKYKIGIYHMLTLVAGLNGKFIWSMLTYTLWGSICLTLAANLHQSNIGSWWLTLIAFLLLMMVSFWLGGIVTLGSFSLRKGLSATGFISAPSFAFAGVTYPLIAITGNAKKWALILPLTHYLNLHIAQLQMDAPVHISISIIWGFMLAVLIMMCLCVLLTHRALNNPKRWGAR